MCEDGGRNPGAKKAGERSVVDWVEAEAGSRAERRLTGAESGVWRVLSECRGQNPSLQANFLHPLTYPRGSLLVSSFPEEMTIT